MSLHAFRETVNAKKQNGNDLREIRMSVDHQQASPSVLFHIQYMGFHLKEMLGMHLKEMLHVRDFAESCTRDFF